MKNLLLLSLVTLSLCAKAQFTIYNTTNSSLSDNHCWLVTHDNLSNLWISTKAGGAFKLTGNNWTNYNTSNSGISTDFATAIKFSANGAAWIGSYLGGVSSLSGATWNVLSTNNSSLPHNDVTAIAIDIHDNKWLGTRFGGLAKYNAGNWTIYNTGNSMLGSNTVYAIELDNSGNVWIGTAFSGLFKFNPTLNTWTNYNTSNSALPHLDVYSLKFNVQTGDMWVGTEGGLAVFNGTNSLAYTVNNSGISGNYVRGITFDPNGTVWVATGFAGINKLQGSTWTTYNTTNSNLPNDSIWAVDIVGTNLWAATYGGGLVTMSYGNDPSPVTSFENQGSTSPLFECYPNPANTKLFLRNLSVKEHLTLYNQLGQKMRELVTESVNFELDVSDLPEGFYYLSMENEQGSLTKTSISVIHK